MLVTGCASQPMPGPTAPELRCGSGTVQNGQECVAVAPAAPVAQEKAPLPRLALADKGAFPFEAHLEQKDLAAMGFAKVFEAGKQVFQASFNGHDGVGALRGPTGEPRNRFTLVPVKGPVPLAMAAQGCGNCHNVPFEAGAGPMEASGISDPDLDGKPPFSVRNVSSLFGNGALQLLAQEMTEELQAAREAAKAEAEKTKGKVEKPLSAKGISFGTIAARPGNKGAVVDTKSVQGVSSDLVVRPFGFQGMIPTLRVFSMAASAAVMGMQPEEFVWRLPKEAGQDPDGDGVTRELSVGDVTAMTIYNAAQEVPASIEHLASLGLVEAPTAAELAEIAQGKAAFSKAQCTSCHVPEMHLNNTIYEEPTKRGNGNYFDPVTAKGDATYSVDKPFLVDLMKDAEAPRLEADTQGGAVVRLYGDLKRHHMGRVLADVGPTPVFLPVFAPLMSPGKKTPELVGPDLFLTTELWGVADTAPYLHDGRAGTLLEAILLHGEDKPPAAGQLGRSEAQESRDAFKALSQQEQKALITFLRSLRTFTANDT